MWKLRFTFRPIVAGSRPSFSHHMSSTPEEPLELLRRGIRRVPAVGVACRDAEGALLAIPPTQRRGRAWTPFGPQAALFNWKYLPSKSERSCVVSIRTTWTPSSRMSMRLPIVRTGCRRHGTAASCQPAPSPISSRPPLNWSIVRARSPGSPGDDSFSQGQAPRRDVARLHSHRRHAAQRLETVFLPFQRRRAVEVVPHIDPVEAGGIRQRQSDRSSSMVRYCWPMWSPNCICVPSFYRCRPAAEA